MASLVPFARLVEAPDEAALLKLLGNNSPHLSDITAIAREMFAQTL